VSFITRLTLPQERLPELDDLLGRVEDALDLELVLDQETLLLQEQERRSTSWCAWPSPQIGVYVEGASTRGVDLCVEVSGASVEVRVTVPVLATWTDWELGVRLVCALLDDVATGARVEGLGQFAAEGMHRTFLGHETRYLAELEAGWSAIATAIEQGRRVRIGGPAGYASIGERCWERLQGSIEEDEDQDELGLRLVQMIQASIEGRGFEDFEEANPLVLDGPGGRRIVTCLLSPGRDLILRNPEYVLLSTDLETQAEAELLLLPFDRFEDAFPALATWLDERCCAVPALPPASWPDIIERIRPMLISVPDLLDSPVLEDEPSADLAPFPTVRAAGPRPDAPKRKWWKLW
jgi:hypothetical protein